MQLQRGLVLHARPYSETSLIIDFFSENDGRLALLAKGARAKRSSLKGALQPFTPLLAAWSGRGDLRTLRHAEASSLALPLAGNYLFSAMYLNELLARLLPAHTPFPDLFLDYVAALTALAKAGCLETALRRFELALLGALGYGVDFDHCAATGAPITASSHYHFDPQCGFILLTTPNAHSFSGAALQMLARGEFSDSVALAGAKRFTRLALKPYLGDKPLKSRELFLSPIRKL